MPKEESTMAFNGQIVTNVIQSLGFLSMVMLYSLQDILKLTN